jgi:hypothetical protein
MEVTARYRLANESPFAERLADILKCSVEFPEETPLAEIEKLAREGRPREDYELFELVVDGKTHKYKIRS